MKSIIYIFLSALFSFHSVYGQSATNKIGEQLTSSLYPRRYQQHDINPGSINYKNHLNVIIEDLDNPSGTVLRNADQAGYHLMDDFIGPENIKISTDKITFNYEDSGVKYEMVVLNKDSHVNFRKESVQLSLMDAIYTCKHKSREVPVLGIIRHNYSSESCEITWYSSLSGAYEDEIPDTRVNLGGAATHPFKCIYQYACEYKRSVY